MGWIRKTGSKMVPELLVNGTETNWNMEIFKGADGEVAFWKVSSRTGEKLEEGFLRISMVWNFRES